MEGTSNTSGRPNLPAYSPLNEQEAWIAIMHACIAVDGDVADEELDVLSDTLAGKSLFEGHDVLSYCRNVFYAHTQVGSKQMIDNSVDKISVDNRTALFSQTIELVLSDGVVADKEKELIKYLYSALDLEQEVADKIVDDIRKLNGRSNSKQPS